jgi:hypothetical protein
MNATLETTATVATPRAQEYAVKMLTVSAAVSAFGFSTSTFMRLRRRHKIQILPGRKVHVDDIIAALERERRHN